MQGIQVMEGPQGTLYGSGSIGGIVRLLPNPVALDHASGAVSAGHDVHLRAAHRGMTWRG